MATGKTPTWRRVGWLAPVGVLLASICSLVSSQIKGDFNKCEVEGAVIDFPVIRGNPCITCYCENGIVRCKKKSCAKLDDCALVLKSLEDDCCEQCKTCFLNGDFFESGQAWTTLDADTGQCQHFQCQLVSQFLCEPHVTAVVGDRLFITLLDKWEKWVQRDNCHWDIILLVGGVWGLLLVSTDVLFLQKEEGVITGSRVQCEPQCEHPFHRDDSCCPVCPGCILNGVFLAEGETSYKQDDPCVECKCEEGGLSCFRRSCPVLSCPRYQMETPPGECCPKCTAQRRVFDLGNRCLFDGGVYEDAEIVFQDDCTLCTCLSATVMCQTTQCPTQYDCPQRLLIRDEGSCCPRCADCEVDGFVYKHNDVWQVSACETCRCSGGRVHCETNTCETAPSSCPGNMKQVLKTPEGECCPRCVERDGTCTVFGDPHYRTFDGRLFNFQGRCKYLLTADCTHNSFRIRVRNDGRGSVRASWSKTVFIHVSQHTITLLQGKKVRVNRTEIKVPFTETSLGHIDIENYIVKVNLNIGIKVLWDGDSFIEVTSSPEFRGQLCGLCGDYDGDRHNDFRTFKGAVVKDVNVFASSWRIGSKADCNISEKNKLLPCRKNSTLKVQAKRDCRIIKSSAFDPCKGEVDQWVYYRSCMTDVCECGPSHSCACEAVLAFIRECQRHGITLPDVYSGNCIL